MNAGEYNRQDMTDDADRSLPGRPSAWKYRRSFKMGEKPPAAGAGRMKTPFPAPNAIVVAVAVFCVLIAAYYAIDYMSDLRDASLILDSGMSSVLELVCSEDGSVLRATGYTTKEDGPKRAMRTWRLPDGRSIGALPLDDVIVEAAALSPDGKLLAAITTEDETGNRRTLSIFASPPGGKPRSLNIECGHVSEVMFSPGGRHLAIIADHIILLDALDGRISDSLSIGGVCRDFAAYFLLDGSFLAKGICGDTLRIWRLSPPEEQAIPLTKEGVRTYSGFSRNGERFVLYSNDSLKVYESRNRSLLHSARPAERAGPIIFMDGKASRIAVREESGAVRVMDAGTSARLTKFHPAGPGTESGARSEFMHPVIPSRDGTRFAIPYYEDGMIDLFDALTGEKLATYKHRDGLFSPAEFNAAAFAPDNSIITAGKRIHTWKRR